MDLIATAPRLPRAGESLLGANFIAIPGGKAGNQAVAAARHGAQTAIVARVGNDAFGDELRRALDRKGVSVGLLQTDENEATGVSPVLMGADGEYSSIIVPGASKTMTVARLALAHAAVRTCAVVLLQFEIGVESSAAAAQLASQSGARVILNASPAPLLREAMTGTIWRHVHAVIVNHHEAQVLTGERSDQPEDWMQLAIRLRRRLDVPVVIVTLGRDGTVYAGVSAGLRVPGHVVPVVDTIGAGDAFAGAIAAALARGDEMERAVVIGNAVGALAVGRRGAHDASPTLAETLAFLGE